MPRLKDTMKKLRKRAYEKSGKKYKDIGRFGEDEYMKQDKLPGMKKGGFFKPVDRQAELEKKAKEYKERKQKTVDDYKKKKEKQKDRALEYKYQKEKDVQELIARRKTATEGSFKKGGLAGKQKKLDANKDGKISGEDFKILRGKANKMKGGGIAIKGTNFKGVF